MKELQLDRTFVMPREVARRLLTDALKLSNKTRKRCHRARETRYLSVAPIIAADSPYLSVGLSLAENKSVQYHRVAQEASKDAKYIGYHDNAIIHETALAIPSEQKTLAKLKTFAIAKLGRMVKRCDIRRRMLQHAFEKTTLEKFKQELSLRADRLDRLRDLVVEEINSRDYPVRIIDPRILRREALLDAIGI